MINVRSFLAVIIVGQFLTLYSHVLKHLLQQNM
jgi:hypothetical protein